MSSAPRWMAAPKGRARSPRWSPLWLGSPPRPTGRMTQGLKTGCADLGKQRGSSRPQQPSGNGLCLQETPRTTQPWAMVSQPPDSPPWSRCFCLSGPCPGPPPCTLPVPSGWGLVTLPRVKAAAVQHEEGPPAPPGPPPPWERSRSSSGPAAKDPSGGGESRGCVGPTRSVCHVTSPTKALNQAGDVSRSGPQRCWSPNTWKMEHEGFCFRCMSTLSTPNPGPPHGVTVVGLSPESQGH